MEFPRRQVNSQERKGQKRKLDEDFDDDEREISIPSASSGEYLEALSCEVGVQVSILNTNFSWKEADRAAAKRATHVLAELAKNEEVVTVIVDGGAVPALVKHLQAPRGSEVDTGLKPFEHEVEKGSAFALGLLAVKKEGGFYKGYVIAVSISEAGFSDWYPALAVDCISRWNSCEISIMPEHQQLIVDTGALPHLVNLLKRHRDSSGSRAANSVIRRAADAITNLAHENSSIKTRVRFFATFCAHLDSIIRLEGGIPPLVELLEFTDPKVQRAAAGALRTLAFKNDENKSQIVECNALPTLILMLRSQDTAIHYEAVGVIGNLVHSSPSIKKEVLSAGALQPVIGLLSSCCSESQREAALLLGQFAATDSDCKVHIVQRGAVRPLIEMLQSSDVQLREMSAFALGRLAQDTHNQAGIAYSGGLVPLLKLLDSRNGSLQHNAAFALYGLADNEDNVSDFIKVGGVQKLQDGEFIVQATKDCVAKTLKRLEEKIHGRKYVLCAGLEFLIGLLGSTSLKQQLDGSAALYKLANKATTLSLVDAAPPSPTPQGNGSMPIEFVYLLLQMHFEPCLMVVIGFIYTGSGDITLDIAQDLLRAADQYLLEGLKRLCEYTIAQDISLENVSSMYELSDAFHAMSLRHTCILFILEHFHKLNTRPGYVLHAALPVGSSSLSFKLN
ncbi:hypothetical protein LguiA_001575 [Lonicera macranthoides]